MSGTILLLLLLGIEKTSTSPLSQQKTDEDWEVMEDGVKQAVEALAVRMKRVLEKCQKATYRGNDI